MTALRQRRYRTALLFSLAAFGCAGSTTKAHSTTTPTNRDIATKRQDHGSTQTSTATVASLPTTSNGFSAPLPARLSAGTIPREELLALLDDGIPRFLAQLTVQAEQRKGRFAGWRLVSLKPKTWANFVLQPGDLVVRVNQHSLERPEQFMQVWESLHGAAEIVFEVVRGDQPSEVRFLISDNRLPVTETEPPTAERRTARRP